MTARSWLSKSNWLALSRTVTCHLIWLRERLGADFVDGVVLTCGPYAYRRRDGIAVVPLGLLGA
jgi:hypothetical protein